MPNNIKTQTGRDKLAPRRNAYFETLSKGRALGFRRGPDTWFARLYTPDAVNADKKTPFEYQPLGQHEDYSAAKKAADAWFNTVTKGAHRAPKRGTVKDALDSYVADLRNHQRTNAADEGERRFKQLIESDKIASKQLDAATREDFEEWRDRLRTGRQPRSINRHVRSVVAGLNKAVRDLGYTGNAAAWKFTKLTDDKEDTGDSAVFLTAEQRERLIEHASKELAAYLRGLEHSGARPSELAAATVADFDAKQGRLVLKHRKGKGSKLRSRAVTLSSTDAKFFASHTANKLPTAPLISNPEGGHWRRHRWARAIRAAKLAIENAKPKQQPIPEGACAYSFRHARISELLQIYGVDPLTVAKQTGTSMAMMEKYYFKFLPDSLLEKLDAVKASGQ